MNQEVFLNNKGSHDSGMLGKNSVSKAEDMLALIYALLTNSLLIEATELMKNIIASAMAKRASTLVSI